MNDLKSKGTKAFIWDFSGKIATHGTGFIVSIFLARLLEPSDFGLIAIVLAILGVASIFTDVGLSSALVQRRKLLQVHYCSVFYFNIVAGMLLTIVIYYSAEWIGYFYNNNDLVPLAQVTSLIFFINSFGSVQSTKLRRELKYGVLAKSTFVASLIGGVSGISLAFYGAGVWSLVAQALLSSIFYNIFIWFRSDWTPSLLFSFKALIKLWGFGFHMFLAAFLDSIYAKLDYLIIGKLFLPATLGFFVRAKSLNLLVVQYSSGSLVDVLFPILSKVKNDLPRFRNIVIRMMGIICFTAFLLLGGLYLISEELIVLLFGEKWLPSVGYFQILVLSGFGYPVSALLVNVLSSRGKSKQFLRLEIYKKSFVTINLIVLYVWGIETYLYGLIITVMLGVYLNILFASREVDLTSFVFIKPIITQAALTIAAVVCTLYIVTGIDVGYGLLLVIKGFLFASLYIAINWFFKTTSYSYLLEQVMPVMKRIVKS